MSDVTFEHTKTTNMLQVSQMCYAEKHRIYEMFRNVVKALVMGQPLDPLRFIARYLRRQHHADVPKVVLVAPPRLSTDAVYIALDLAKCTGAVTIDRRNVLLRYQKKRVGDERSTDFANALTEYMRAKGALEKGWILLGIPNDKTEADRLISLGVLPTHTIVLDDDDDDDAAVIVANDVQQTTPREDSERLRYENFRSEIKTKFRSTLKEIRVRDQSIDQLMESCLERILRQRPSVVPFQPRVAIVGPKGANSFVAARAISKKFNTVHVDFEQILIHKKIDDDSKTPDETIHSWIKEKITQDDCVEKGYVLTGFPRTKNDFQWLDSTEMAPNRVIFLVMDLRDLYVHYANRCYDESSGAFVSLDQAVDGLKSGTMKFERLSLRGPSDSKELLREFKTYCDRLRAMLCYCGDNCYLIQTDAADGSLVDKLSACVTSGSPATGPRPQNREPSRLVGSLRKKMFPPYDDDKMLIHSVAQVLSADARKLLNALERKKIDHRSSGKVFC